MGRSDGDESVGIEMDTGRVVRVRDDHDASGIQRRVDLVERRDLCASGIESPARERLQVVGVRGHRHLHGSVIELAAHRPNELAGTATGDHRPVGHTGGFAVQLDELGSRLVGMQHDVVRLNGV
jgi:hypothetical protein